MTYFWNNLHQVMLSQKIGKPNHLKFQEQVNQRVYKQDRQNLLQSPVPEGGECVF